VGNRLLGALSPVVLKRLDVRQQVVEDFGVLCGGDRDTSADVYFPHPGAMIALTRGTVEGPQVEVGVVGSEGFANLSSLMSSGPNATNAVVQIGGMISRVSSVRLRAEFANDPRTRALLLSYGSLFLEHMTQSVVCNRVHTIEQRLSKWLLILRDRIGSDDVHVSHDFLSQMLGIQRSGATIAIGILSEHELITHARKLIHVHDSQGLMLRACECFAVMLAPLTAYRAQLSRSTPRPAARATWQ
jgi:CRP-like cAMP-binding protein